MVNDLHDIATQAMPASLQGRIASPVSATDLWAFLKHPSPGATGTRHIGEALLNAKVINSSQLQLALRTQELERSHGVHHMLGRNLVDSGVISKPQLDQVIAGWLGAGVVDVSHYEFDSKALARVSAAVAERESVLPLMLHDDLLVVLMVDPQDRRLLEELRFMTQCRILGVLPAPGTLMPAIARAYAKPEKPRAIAAENPRASSRDLAKVL